MEYKYCYVIYEIEDWSDSETRGEWFTVCDQILGLAAAREYIEKNEDVIACKKAGRPVIGPLVHA